MNTDDLREKLRDELAEAIYGALSGSFGDFGGNHSRRAADALMPIIEAHEAEAREQIAARLDHRESHMRASSAENPSELCDYSAAVAFGVAARIARGQA